MRLVENVAERNPQSVIEAPPALTSLLHEEDAPEEAVIRALTNIAEVYPDAVVPATTELLGYVEEGNSRQRIGALVTVLEDGN